MSIQEIEDAVRTASTKELRRMLRVIQERLAAETGGDGAPASLDDAERDLPKTDDDSSTAEPTYTDRIMAEWEASTARFEDVAHLAGAAKGGPPDLSSNKRYMEGFGESSLR
ncbi:MAG: hypothetical protein Rubg2KO_09490 [Rubricoccaceae bacterium]